MNTASWIKSIAFCHMAAIASVSCSAQDGNLKKTGAPALMDSRAADHGKQVSCADISCFLPKGTTVRLEQRGDMDGDGDIDVLVVLQKSNSDVHRFEPRTLMVLRRDADGHLQKAGAGKNAILCQACGGMMGDPLQGIRIDSAGFTLRFEGGSRELWSQEYRFVYSAHAHAWILHEINGAASNRLNGSSSTDRLGQNDFGLVSLGQFDPIGFPANALP